MEFELFEYYNKVGIPSRLKGDILDNYNTPVSFITGISKVNLFVGTNNSGKSLLLREILKLKKLENYPSINIKNEINDFIKSRLNLIVEILNKHNYQKIQDSYTSAITEEKINNSFIKFDDNFQTISEYSTKGIIALRELWQATPRTFAFKDKPHMPKTIPAEIRDEIIQIQTQLKDFISVLEANYTYDNELKKIYIPTIRTLRKYTNIQFLEQKTRKEYSLDKSVLIENGQGMFASIQDMMMDEYDVQQRKTDFEEFLSEEFFQGEKVRLTPNKKQNELTLKIGSEKERPIYDLGEGLQMMLILTFPIFFFEAGIITIEEPEIFLHPGFQHKLLNTFSNHPKSRNFIFLISTHSNHILDNVNYQKNISVYSSIKIKKNVSGNEEPQFIISKLAEPGFGLLDLLGVRNTSVFLSNSTIWVEGITDMLYLRKYIEEYLKGIKPESKYKIFNQFQEGIHYSFILTGGSSIIHYDFSDEPLIKSIKDKVVTKNICGKAIVIVDNDDNKHKPRKQKFFKDLNGRFKELSVIEIENLLSNDVIKSVIGDYPTCKEISIEDKNLLPEKKYANLRLGSYIDDKILKSDKTKRRKRFKEDKDSKNSTLNCKLEFCQKALKFISYTNMTTSSKKVVESILDFVIDRNENPLREDNKVN